MRRLRRKSLTDKNLDVTRVQTDSWIFLSLGMISNATPVSLSETIGVADGINIAIPTHAELSAALGWLLNDKLAEKVGRKYQITKFGGELLARARNNSEKLFDVWEYLEKEFVLMKREADLEQITEVEVNEAYQVYKQRIWEAYRKLEKSDKS
jgi:hypothetical protein